MESQYNKENTRDEPKCLSAILWGPYFVSHTVRGKKQAR